ncbi:MAG: hypothetical protein IKU60_01155 [Clostridia bacterium]|nr:hypothetical protein [Clostridia bacterium]
MDEKNKEFVAKKNWDTWQKALFIGVIAVTLVVFWFTKTIAFMIAFLFVLAALSLYYMKNTFKAEFAYTISSRMVVEILKSGGKRVPVCDFFLADMTLCGKYDDMAKSKLTSIGKTYVAATDVKDGEETYFALFERNGSSNLVLFTPNDMMLDEMRKHTKCIIEN